MLTVDRFFVFILLLLSLDISIYRCLKRDRGPLSSISCNKWNRDLLEMHRFQSPADSWSSVLTMEPFSLTKHQEFSESYFVIGVDVGTASVRAGLYSLASKTFQKTAIQPIAVHRSTVNVWDAARDPTELISQSSSEIWSAVCKTVQEVSAGVSTTQIRGIGFDATCSLVVVGPGDQPFPVDGVLPSPLVQGSADEVSCLDVIMWQDHRAKKETDFINQTLANHSCLKFVGGQVSLEMQLPKLLWLKTHRPAIYHSATHFMDLCDFLTWKATGCVKHTPSMCSVVCKWLYQVNPTNPSQHGWDSAIFHQIGLGDLCDDGFRRIGSEIGVPGQALADGLSEASTRQLGLETGTSVATALIDAHAGGLALAYCGGVKTDRTKRLGLICGTSTCYMQCSDEPVFVPGVWGPYFSAMIPGLWLNEAGQSAAGQFLDHIIQTHPYYLTTLQSPPLTSCYELLNKRALELATAPGDVAFLTNQLHIFPDYHGNRSPLSNPEMKGMIMGLTLDGASEMSLVKLYLAALQGLAYESRWIIECMFNAGIRVKDVALCGGMAGNPVFVQTLADVVGMPVLLPDTKESVMLGAAILAATASGCVGSLEEAGTLMAGGGRVVEPIDRTELYHKARYRVFRQMADFQLTVLKQ